MTPDALEAELRRLAPVPGPTPEAVAFRAGELAGGRRARRRLVPALGTLGLVAAVGWAVVLGRPAPSPALIVEPVPPEFEAPPAWRGGYDILAGMDPDTLADPPAVSASTPPPMHPEDDP